MLQISSIAASGTGFASTTSCGATLAIGDTCNIVVSFTPTAVGTNYTGQVTVTSNAGAPQTAPLTGAGVAQTVPVLTWQPVVSTLAFGNVVPGTSSAIQSVELLNQGAGRRRPPTRQRDRRQRRKLLGDRHLHRRHAAVPGSDLPHRHHVFARVLGCQAGDDPGGPRTGTSPSDVTLTGNGLGGASPAVAVSAATLGFDATTVGGRSVPLSVTLSSSGVAAVNVAAMTVSGPFTIQSSTCPTPPFTLASGIDCTVTLSFSPTATGAATGKLAVMTDADPAELDVALSGNADAAPDVGGGGCTIGGAGSPFDPALWFMVMLAAAWIAARQRQKKKAARASTRDAQPRPPVTGRSCNDWEGIH